MPLKEDFISLHLTTPYQINKTTGEMYSNFYYHHYGLKTVNCRFFNSLIKSKGIFSLPLYPELTEKEVNNICKKIKDCLRIYKF